MLSTSTFEYGVLPSSSSSSSDPNRKPEPDPDVSPLNPRNSKFVCLRKDQGGLEGLGGLNLDLDLSLSLPPLDSPPDSSPLRDLMKKATTTSMSESTIQSHNVFSVSDVFGEVLAAAQDEDHDADHDVGESDSDSDSDSDSAGEESESERGLIPIDPGRVGIEIEEIEAKGEEGEGKTEAKGREDREEEGSLLMSVPVPISISGSGLGSESDCVKKKFDDPMLFGMEIGTPDDRNEGTSLSQVERVGGFGVVAAAENDSNLNLRGISEVHILRTNASPSSVAPVVIPPPPGPPPPTSAPSDVDADPDADPASPEADVLCATAPRHVFKKALQMESELAEVREACARAESAKTYLEQAVSSKDTAIATTRHELGLAMQDLGRVRESLGVKESEVRDLRSHYEALYLMKHPNRIDRVDEVVRLRDELIVLKRELEEKEKEIRVLRVCGRRKEASIVRMEERRTEEETCLKNRVEVLEGRIGKANVENSRLRECLANEKRVSEMKMKALGKISRELEDNHASAEERIADLRKVIDTKDQQIRFLNQQRREEERRLMPNSRLHEESPPQATSRVVRVLEEEHKYLQKKLIVQTDTVEKQKRSLRMLERLTMRLRSRLSDVDLALRDLDLEDYIRRKFLLKARSQVDSSEEDSSCSSGGEEEEEQAGEVDSEKPVDNAPVPPQVYLLVKKDAEVLRTKSESLSTMIDEKDAVIESLERHVRVLQKSAASKDTFARKKMISLRRKMERMETENVTLEKTVHRLEIQLRQAVRRRGSRPNTSKRVSRAQRSTRRVPRK